MSAEPGDTMTSKSELKRKATLDPLWAAQRIAELEEVLEYCANPEGDHTDALFKVSTDCADGDYYREVIKRARKALGKNG